MIEIVEGHTERFTLHSGNFFLDSLPAADAYILMEVIHDWDDRQAEAILSAVRRAAAPGATVLIIEAVADEERMDPVVRTLDVIMLAITGGRERTSAELGHLLANAGLRATTTLQTQGALRIVRRSLTDPNLGGTYGTSTSGRGSTSSSTRCRWAA